MCLNSKGEALIFPGREDVMNYLANHTPGFIRSSHRGTPGAMRILMIVFTISFSMAIVGCGTSGGYGGGNSGGTASPPVTGPVTFFNSAPTSLDGALTINNVSVTAASATETQVTATGTVNGVAAYLDVIFENGTGANPRVTYAWGSPVQYYLYCVGSACTGTMINPGAGNSGSISFSSTSLTFGGTSAMVSGTMTY